MNFLEEIKIYRFSSETRFKFKYEFYVQKRRLIIKIRLGVFLLLKRNLIFHSEMKENVLILR